jgi:hypothetical protein
MYKNLITQNKIGSSILENECLIYRFNTQNYFGSRSREIHGTKFTIKDGKVSNISTVGFHKGILTGIVYTHGLLQADPFRETCHNFNSPYSCNVKTLQEMKERLEALPLSNSATIAAHERLQGPEVYRSLKEEILWTIRTLIDPTIGSYFASPNGAIQSVPTFGKRALLVDCVSLGRTLGLESNELYQTSLDKYVKHVGSGKGARPDYPVSSLREPITVKKILAYNSTRNRLNKFKVTDESITDLTNFMFKRMKRQPYSWVHQL